MEALYIKGKQQGPQLNISDIGVQTATLPEGIYKVYATCDCYIKIDEGTASDVTPLTGDILLKGNTELYHVGENDRIGVVADTGVTGKLKYHWVGRRSS